MKLRLLMGAQYPLVQAYGDYTIHRKNYILPGKCNRVA